MKPPKTPRPVASHSKKPQNLNEECLLAYLSQGVSDVTPGEAASGQIAQPGINPFDLGHMSAWEVIQAQGMAINPRLTPNTLI